LGLSATPKRWFDDLGSKVIVDYFGNCSFEFTIKDALTKLNPLTGKHFLINYYYHPYFVSLTEDELEYYFKISEKIKKMSFLNNAEDDGSGLKFMLFQRANLEKNAFNKYEKLEMILDEITEKMRDTIIFVSPEQIDTVMKILGMRNISAHKFTQAEGTVPKKSYGDISEREYIIRKFKMKEYHVLVAIKCLDEGIDIPSAKRAIIMASSTNPREYIQRIGRVIRQDNNKYRADIYDLILHPDIPKFLDESMIKLEKKIFKKEMVRVKELSEYALNNSKILKELYEELRGE
jgi:superfamily II DNA or RNA helicase